MDLDRDGLRQVYAIMRKIRAFDYIDAPPLMITAPHTPVPFSPALEDNFLPSVEDIVSGVQAHLD